MPYYYFSKVNNSIAARTDNDSMKSPFKTRELLELNAGIDSADKEIDDRMMKHNQQ